MTDQKANKFNAHDNDESLMLPLSLPLHQDITHPQYLTFDRRIKKVSVKSKQH